MDVLTALQNSGFKTIDFVILVIYLIVLVSLGLFLSRNKDGKEKSANDYFLAGNTLTWWAVGASLIAANISAEQFIGMSGTGFADGIAIAAYEVMAAVTLVVIGKFLLPIMLKQRIFTIPQFLRERYNDGVGLAFSILWLFLYVFVNLTSVAWLGALAIEQILGLQGLAVEIFGMTISIRMIIIFLLFLIAGIYSIYGGLASVAWTDVMQVTFLVGGGLITAYFALREMGLVFDTDALGAFNKIYTDLTTGNYAQDTHFHLVIRQSHNPEAFANVPGIAAVVGGVWLTNLGYWGFNQYIIQKGLAAKNVDEAKKGLVFAGFLKILIPFIVVLPGICAYYIAQNPESFASMNLQGKINIPDDAYPWLIRNFTPVGIKGLSFAALTAAIISSLASMFNSTSTLFTMDIYKKYLEPKATDKKLVNVGRLTSVTALFIALFTVKPLLGGIPQAFQYIVLFKIFLGDVPFQFRAGYIFIILVSFFIIMSLLDKKYVHAEEPAAVDKAMMKRWAQILGGLGIIMIITAIIVVCMGNATELTTYLNDIGFQAFIFFGVLVGCNGVWLWSNATSSKKDPKALPIDLGIFTTTRGYTWGTIGICVITLILYAVLW